MSLLKVARMGHPVLRKAARRLDPTELRTAPIQKLIEDMMETMTEYSGIGLAGPQVHEPLRLFVAGIENEEGRLKVLPFINPEIEPVGDAMEEDWEGCLSIPDIRGRVPRHRDIVVHALDRRGKPFDMELHGFPARVVQHETDHLDGVLFLDRMTSFASLAFLDEYARFWARDEGEDEAL
jgi:peptide deformylase